jgi:hypothetical protein
MNMNMDAYDGIHQQFGQEVHGVHVQKLSVKMDNKRWSVNTASWGTRHKHIRALPLKFYEV